MTTSEFSTQWDLLYNNIASNSAPGLDEYEKSVFLTEAVKEVTIALYNGTLGKSFEEVESTRKYLSNLVRTVELQPLTSPTYTGISSLTYNEESFFFALPNDLMFITYEAVEINDPSVANCINNRSFEVVPTTQDEYRRVKDNPFRKANNRRVLRFDVENINNQHVVELISKYNIDNYLVRYIRKPNPIILENFTGGETIEGLNTITECELDPSLHQIILETAVNKALQIRPK